MNESHTPTYKDVAVVTEKEKKREGNEMKTSFHNFAKSFIIWEKAKIITGLGVEAIL